MAGYYNLYEARTRLSRIVDRAAAGEEIIIGKSGKPLVKLIPYQPGKRQPGIWEGKLQLEEGFDAPLPKELLDAFEGPSP